MRTDVHRPDRASIDQDQRRYRRRIAAAFRFDIAFAREAMIGIFRRSRADGDTVVEAFAMPDRSYARLLNRNPRPDGIIIAAETAKEAIEIAEGGLPAVNIASLFEEHARLPVVANDENLVGRAVAEFFLERRHRQFAFLAPNFTGAPLGYFEPRKQGFLTRLREAGYDAAVHETTMFDHDEVCRWVTRLPKPVAVMVAGDWIGERFMACCWRAGVRVPEEVSVVGVDNDTLPCLAARPSLSSLVTSASEIGARAYEVLVSILEGTPPPPVPVLVPPGPIMERESTDSPPVSDPDVAAALSLVRSRLGRRLTVPEVASAVSLTPRTLQRRFARAVGRTLQEEIRRTRVKHACDLLVETEFTIAEVARKAGFVRPQHLAVALKRDVGRTPTQYRREMGREAMARTSGP